MTSDRAKVPIFLGKDRSDRYQGIVTKVGVMKFEYARQRLARMAGLKASQVSDGDTFEYLARGERDTRRYLKVGGRS